MWPSGSEHGYIQHRRCRRCRHSLQRGRITLIWTQSLGNAAVIAGEKAATSHTGKGSRSTIDRFISCARDQTGFLSLLLLFNFSFPCPPYPPPLAFLPFLHPSPLPLFLLLLVFPLHPVLLFSLLFALVFLLPLLRRSVAKQSSSLSCRSLLLPSIQ